MTVIGDPGLWSNTFPEDLVPRILDLVTDTWEGFEKPAANDHEVPITRRFKHRLKQAKDYRKLPVRIERELAEDDPATGAELGRIDLKFLPAMSALEEVYFAFECKRLNALVNGTRRTLASEYVTEGMMRFVTGQYSASMAHGGMIGYILDGKRDDAIRLVEQNVGIRRGELMMDDPANLTESRVRPDSQEVRESVHKLSRPFLLHHLFLACPTIVNPVALTA
ncbi:MAG TPA: hypothetical protein VHR66_28405 [Gemmataceae bacterium]|jgi:hypothetical protein|nr:hypothetical protein [Gemmataceae bacterium]